MQWGFLDVTCSGVASRDGWDAFTTVGYWANLQGHGRSHPTRVVMQVCWEHERVQSYSIGWVCGAFGKDLGLEDMEFSPTVPLPIRPPWLIVEPIVDLQILNSQLKSREEVDLCEVFYNHLNDEFNGYLDIYTDGSKDPQSGQTGAAPNMEHQRWESK